VGHQSFQPGADKSEKQQERVTRWLIIVAKDGEGEEVIWEGVMVSHAGQLPVFVSDTSSDLISPDSRPAPVALDPRPSCHDVDDLSRSSFQQVHRNVLLIT